MDSDTVVMLLLFAAVMLSLLAGYFDRKLIRTYRSIVATQDEIIASLKRQIAAQEQIINILGSNPSARE